MTASLKNKASALVCFQEKQKHKTKLNFNELLTVRKNSQRNIKFIIKNAWFAVQKNKKDEYEFIYLFFFY